MAYDINAVINREKKILPPRLLAYGPEGIGKSTLGDLAPNAIFARTEEDRGLLASPQETIENFDQLMEMLEALATQEHDRQVFNLDSVDWLEPMVYAKTCQLNNWADIEAPGYGKGYKAAEDVWRELFTALNYLGEARGMTVIAICHAKAKGYKNPETEAYDRYNLKVRDETSALWREWADAVLFINYKVSISKEKEGFGAERKRAVSTGAQGENQRIIYTTERAAAIAKNRYNLPPQIPFDKEGKYWITIAEHIPFLRTNFLQESTASTETNSTETKEQ